jgi:hypothetical protein
MLPGVRGQLNQAILFIGEINHLTLFTFPEWLSGQSKINGFDQDRFPVAVISDNVYGEVAVQIHFGPLGAIRK